MQVGTGMMVNWLLRAATEERLKKKDAHTFQVNNDIKNGIEAKYLQAKLRR